MKKLRISTWVLLALFLGLYTYCWIWPGHYLHYHPGLRVTDDINLAIDYQAKSFVAYSDRVAGPHRPYYMVSYYGQGVTQIERDGFYYLNYRPTGSVSWTLGISQLYLLIPIAVLVAIFEFRAATIRRRRKTDKCPSCGYLRQGLMATTTHCPECGYELPGNQIRH